MKKNWFLWFLAGALSLIGGLMALANPFAASLTAEMLAGWMFLFSGIAMLISAIANEKGMTRIAGAVFAVLVAALGMNLLNHPLKGLVSLTAAAGVMLLAAGAARLWWAFKTSGSARTALLVSAALSLLLGVMIIGNFPASAATMLGIFLGAELLSNGISLMLLALQSRKQPANNKETAAS